MDVARAAGFVAREAMQRHVGVVFAGLAAAGAVLLAAVRTTAAARPAIPAAWIIGTIYVAAPFLVLTLHPQKSEVVVGALVPGIVLLVVAAWMSVSRRADPASLRFFAGAVAAATLALFARGQRMPAYSPETRADIRQVNTIADTLYSRVSAGNLREPHVAVDYITDSLDAQVLRVVVYERKRRWMQFRIMLPTGIAEPTSELVHERLAKSDFVFLTEEAPVGPYPFDRKLAEMRPDVRAWCEANLRAADRFTLFGRRMVLYQRREIPLP
jgi:hypothetical protein